MADDNKEVTREEAKADVQKRLVDIEKKSKKTTETKRMDLSQQFATRSMLERDYDEDIIPVKFKSSPQTERVLAAHRPNNAQMIKMISLGIQISKLQTNPDTNVEDLDNVLSELAKIAEELTIDKSLNSEFWQKKVSSNTLQGFINALMSSAQNDYSGITEEEMKTFR